MTLDVEAPLEGGCTCGAVRYSLTRPAAVRALLPLPMVPARDRRLVRAERDDRGRSRRPAQGRAGDRRTRLPRAARDRRSFAARRAGSRCGATMPVRATRCASCASARWTSPIGSRRISISSRRRSSPGSCCRRGSRRSREYYDRERHWPRVEPCERPAARRCLAMSDTPASISARRSTSPPRANGCEALPGPRRDLDRASRLPDVRSRRLLRGFEARACAATTSRRPDIR